MWSERTRPWIVVPPTQTVKFWPGATAEGPSLTTATYSCGWMEWAGLVPDAIAPPPPDGMTVQPQEKEICAVPHGTPSMIAISWDDITAFAPYTKLVPEAPTVAFVSVPAPPTV